MITTAKGSPRTVLQVPSEQSEEEGDIDPILAITQYGLGKTAAFTSDLSANWAAEWLRLGQISAFVHQLVTEISQCKRPASFRMWTYVGAKGRRRRRLAEHNRFWKSRPESAAPRPNRIGALKQVGPRRYQASVPLWGKGRYHVVGRPVGEDRKDDRAFGGFIIPYSPEYLRFRSNPLVLNDIVKGTSGELLEPDAKAEDIYDRDRQPKRSSRPIFDWFLVILACLVPLDVGVRRIQIDWYVIKGWLNRAAARSTQTIAVERRLSGQLEARRSETPPRGALWQQLAKPPAEVTPRRRALRPTPPGSKPVPDEKATTTTASAEIETKAAGFAV